MKKEMKFRTKRKSYVEIEFNIENLQESQLYLDGYKFIGYPYLAGCEGNKIGFACDEIFEMDGKKYRGILLEVSKNIVEEFQDIVANIRRSGKGWIKKEYDYTLSEEEGRLLNENIKFTFAPFTLSSVLDPEQVTAFVKKYMLDKGLKFRVDFTDLYISVRLDNDLTSYGTKNGINLGGFTEVIIPKDLFEEVVERKVKEKYSL